MLTAQEVYTTARTLSLPERLRLAALILEELHQQPPSQVGPTSLTGYSDAWTDEDRQDLSCFSATHFASTEISSVAEQDAALPPLKDLLKMKLEQSLEPEHI